MATTAHTTQALDAELPCNGNYVFFGHWATPEGVIEYHGGMPHSSNIYWGNLIPTEIQQISMSQRLDAAVYEGAKRVARVWLIMLEGL